ncbi:hypothetical protein LTR10_013076 [Elasticomyces elasticus]|uniref:Major facilitator superfamily (MFS) profile domain-containing protein n=1 Tax=Exophiala sideris TaxID=1016849 RepID=A0ABR0JBJ2_9EURO|nr:hypothetical protein LTR10_013076 [Elasticomyces elasticus]KAK5030451.1 hypothetical protein LTS07_005235 [Exophiala sideris]KAK5038504.1 hypothetical protein LTR13_004251 [Exophiala sideris]KAK5060387.1 hypothetical protein LTR69_005704 [Exophiala sideris]KAK5183297.1 hypothetical protein LTR44_004298 [Eurotiomycetes sp. CCFEE 6388]
MAYGKLTLRDIAIVLALSLGSITYGYDFSIISTTVGQPSWYAYMGLTTDATSPNYSFSNSMLDTVFGLFSAGAIFGGLFVGWYSDAHGRQKALLIGNLINIVGGALQAGSAHIGMFIAARFITGFSGAMIVTLVPIYIAEVAPPAVRGLLVGQHGAFFLVGYTLAAWVGVGSYYSPNAAFNWRFPLSLQVLWPLLQLCVLVWLPESPRWLVRQGRSDEAWRILARLYHNPSDGQQLFAREQFFQIKAQCEADQAAYGDVNYLDLFRKPHFRKRALIATLVMWASQANGAIVIYSNIVVLVAGLGFDNAESLFLAAGWITLACVGNFANAYYLDKLGRIRSLMIGITGCIVCVIIEAAIVANYGGTDNKSALSAGVAMLFLFICFYAGFVDTTVYVYCSEIFPTHIRAKGMGWSIAIFFLSTLPFLESSATGFATIGWKYYLLFIILPSINVILLYLFCPETKGQSLEEIGAFFNDNVAIRLTHISEEEKRALDERILAEQTIINGQDVSAASNSADSEKTPKVTV